MLTILLVEMLLLAVAHGRRARVGCAYHRVGMCSRGLCRVVPRKLFAERVSSSDLAEPKLPIRSWWNAVVPESEYMVSPLYLGEP